MDKRLSYSQNTLVERYDRRRFCGRSGGFINLVELNTVYSLMEKYSSRTRIILDAPCGTGRLSQFLNAKGLEVIGIDYSESMIKQTLNKINISITRGDMFSLPIKDSSIGCIVSLRFMFHYKFIRDVLLELKRVVCDDGVIIFDTFNWSPKSSFIFGDKRVFIHTRRNMKYLLKEIGLSQIDERHCFLVSPQIYRVLPYHLTKFMRLCEKIVPSNLLVRSFWCARKSS